MSWTVGAKDADGWTVAPKGSTVPIQKSEFVVGVGWDAKAVPGGPEFDLDVGVFFVDGRGKMTAPTDFLYYSNRSGPNQSVQCVSFLSFFFFFFFFFPFLELFL